MERTKDEYEYFIVKISFKNSQLPGKLVFLANSFGERTVSVIRRGLAPPKCLFGTPLMRRNKFMKNMWRSAA